MARRYLGTMSYFDQLEMSPKYRTFRKLKEEVYEPFDADQDILTLEMGSYVYRGYFTNFRFSIVKDSPGNWSYEIGFVIINDLSAKLQRGDEAYNSGSITTGL